MLMDDEPSERIHKIYQVKAELPFPLRLEGGPYRITGDSGEADLTFETVRQGGFDQRLNIERFDGDFQVDRYGWASYTRLTSEVKTDGARDPIYVLLQCLNLVIRHLRDLGELYWLYELEAADLFRVMVESAGTGQAVLSWGRTQGVHNRVEGLTDAAEKAITARLDQGEQVSEWRLLYLDAEDAFSLGKYEQAVLLGWSALEVASRTATPIMARAAGLSPQGLRSRVDPGSKQIPFSLEEVTERAPALDVVRVFCELANASHDPRTLAYSTKTAWHLRNVVTHRGVRISPGQARKALNAVRYVFLATRVPTCRSLGSFDDGPWREHFGTASLDMGRLLELNTGRVVPFKIWSGEEDPLTNWFQLERSDDFLAVRFQEDMTESIAAALTIVTNDSYGYGGGTLPSLVVSEHTPAMLISEVLNMTAGTVTEAVHWSHAGMVRAAAGLEIQPACDYAVDKIWRAFTRMGHTIEPRNTLFAAICTRIASYLFQASPQAFQRFRQGMAVRHRDIFDGSTEVMRILRSLEVGNAHSICQVLRQLHDHSELQGSLFWLNTIVVRCPMERAEYGTSRRDMP